MLALSPVYALYLRVNRSTGKRSQPNQKNTLPSYFQSRGTDQALASPSLLARGEHSLVEGFAAKEAQWLAERERLMADAQSARWDTP